jgi:hypothetical protein
VGQGLVNADFRSAAFGQFCITQRQKAHCRCVWTMKNEQVQGLHTVLIAIYQTPRKKVLVQEGSQCNVKSRVGAGFVGQGWIMYHFEP